ncbi:LuxR C-terminal-related transcriptional regulator [Streptomyces sp. MST-110588]|uniref:helix-turn-helix transcriptional regulator n=1 Tax=Streptomyces sp. MST-110588 TaxID=2833628 RepID=UPI001F5D4DD2|nr:LuxR C-terminal-related transcriptional regulator [Streptomyces sp. MST-110588]
MEDEILRLGLQALIPALPLDIEASFVVDEREFAPAVRAFAPDVIVVSSALRRRTQAQREEIGGPRCRWLVIVEEHEMGTGAELAVCAADGYLVRRKLSAQALGRALGQLAAGEMAIPLEVGRQLIRQAGGVPAAGHRPARLTGRETETLMLLVHGLSNKQIGRRLRISEHGAKRLVSSVLLKLDAANRTSAVVKAIKAGLVDDEALAKAVSSSAQAPL